MGWREFNKEVLAQFYAGTTWDWMNQCLVDNVRLLSVLDSKDRASGGASLRFRRDTTWWGLGRRHKHNRRHDKKLSANILNLVLGVPDPDSQPILHKTDASHVAPAQHLDNPHGCQDPLLVHVFEDLSHVRLVPRQELRCGGEEPQDEGVESRFGGVRGRTARLEDARRRASCASTSPSPLPGCPWSWSRTLSTPNRITSPYIPKRSRGRPYTRVRSRISAHQGYNSLKKVKTQTPPKPLYLIVISYVLHVFFPSINPADFIKFSPSI